MARLRVVGRFATRYQEGHRLAAYQLIHVQGLTSKQAAAEIAKGWRDLPPIDMPADSARHYANKYRRTEELKLRRELARTDPRYANDALARDIIQGLRVSLDAWLKQKPTTRDPAKVREIAKAAKEAEALLRTRDNGAPLDNANGDGEAAAPTQLGADLAKTVGKKRAVAKPSTSSSTQDGGQQRKSPSRQRSAASSEHNEQSAGRIPTHVSD